MTFGQRNAEQKGNAQAQISDFLDRRITVPYREFEGKGAFCKIRNINFPVTQEGSTSISPHREVDNLRAAVCTNSSRGKKMEAFPELYK